MAITGFSYLGMHRFNQMFQAYIKNVSRSPEVNSEDWEWGLFVRFCRYLVSMRQYDVILEYMFSVFSHYHYFNLAHFKKALDNIPVAEDCSLADLCQQYYLDVYHAEKDGFLVPIPESVDLYKDFQNEYVLYEGGPIWRKAQLETISRCVYHKPLDADTFTLQDIEDQIDMIRQETTAAYLKDCGEKEARNNKIRQKDEQFGRRTMTFQVIVPLDTFRRDQGLPGLLIPFLAVAELNGKSDLYFQILEKYLLPYLADVPWERIDRKEPISLAAIKSVADYLQSAILKEANRFNVNLLTSFPTAESHAEKQYLNLLFYNEATGKTGETPFLFTREDFNNWCREHLPIAKLWAAVLHKSRDHLRKAVDSWTLSFHIFTVSYMLYCGGATEDTRKFLIDHYNDMESEYKRKPETYIMLARCVLSDEQLESANVLHGYYTHTVSHTQWNKHTTIARTKQIVDYLRSAKAYIRQADPHTRDDGRSIYEIMYGDGKIDAMLNEADKALLQGRPVDEQVFKKLRKWLDAFSYPTGVHLGMLGLPNINGYDKLDFVLPREFVGTAPVDQSWLNEIKKYYSTQLLSSAHETIDIDLQNHILKLRRDQASKFLQKVSDMKKELPENCTPEEEALFMARLEELADKMSTVLMDTSWGKQEIEQELAALRQGFTKQYLDSDQDLMNKLPLDMRQEVMKCLTTSNMVFKMMVSGKDENWDYSAAMISLTKVLELVMHQIYTKMNVVYDPIKDEKKDTKGYYFDPSGNPLDKLTLRPYNMLLQSKQFLRWDGPKVVDLSVLARFKDIDLHINKEKNGVVTEAVTHFNDDPEYNRKQLIKALEFVRENYRNRAAHQGDITLNDMAACKQILIDSHYLLWILLAILR